MKLHKLILSPFAGFSNREIEFKTGLNVVLGPNDIGKSTVFRAIESAFFLQTKLKANTVEGKELKRMIPLGGDHAQVTVNFESKGQSYRLEKTWGPNPTCKLVCDHLQQTLNTSDRIETVLRDLFPVPSATFRNIFISKQNTLDRTLDELSQNPESLHSFGDILRLSVQQSADFSVDEFKSLLAKQIEEATLNWDPTTHSPKKGRGIENPWDRQGTVLSAFYRKERLKKRWTETQSMETELGEKNKLLGEKLSRELQIKTFIQANHLIVDALGARKALSVQLEQSNRDTAQLVRDLNRWIQIESDLKVTEPEIARLEAVLTSLQEELKVARLETNRRSLLARFERIELAQKELEAKKAALAIRPQVRPEDIQSLRNLWSSIEKNKASLSAAQLQMSFLAKAGMTIRFKRDLDPEKDRLLHSGENWIVQAGGRIQLVHPDFEMTISSGDGKMERTEAQLRKDSEALRTLLAQLQVRSLEEAQDKSEKWQLAAQATRIAESALTALLAGENYENLKKQIQDSPTSSHIRPIELIEKDHLQLNSLLATKKGQFSACQKILLELKTRHESQESSHLTSLMIRNGIEQETLKKQISELPPLPEGVRDADEFLTQFKQYQFALPALSEETRTLSNQAVEIQTRMPECSAQDLLREYRDAVQDFDRELEQLKSLLRIHQGIQKIEFENQNRFDAFQTHLESDFEKLSLGKYKKTVLKDSLPIEFSKENGKSIPFSWLSAGTRDGFALSLRLTIASYFLKNSTAFILLDDPMVSLDPERQKIVTELLSQFADRSQVILFTCHPAHADLMGGNLIHLT